MFEKPKNFFNDIGNIFTFPFKPQGIAAIAIGGIIFGIASFIASWAGCIGFIISAIVAAYLLTYEFKIINNVANGEDDVPNWPDPGGVFETLFQVMGCYFICFAPAIICLVISVVAAATLGPLAIVPLLASLVLSVAGAFYFPMAYMITAMFTTPWPALNLAFGFRSIGKILPEYMIVFLITVLFFGITGGVWAVFKLAGVFGPEAALLATIPSAFVSTFIGLYLRIANGYMLGRLYWTCEHKLQWFPGTEHLSSGPPPQVYGQAGTTRVPGPGPEGGPLPARQGGGTELHTRRQAPSFGTAQYAPSEDPFHKFREEKIGEQASAAEKKGETDFESLMDKAHTGSKPTQGLERGGRPVSGGEELPDRQQAASGGELAGKRSDFYSATGPVGAPGAQEGSDPRRPTGAHQRPTGAHKRPTGAYPVEGQETGVRRPTGAHQRPTGAHPAPGGQSSPTFQPPPVTDDHAGPVRFEPEIQSLIDTGEFEEARKMVEQKREAARMQGNLAQISFYRKQLDIIDMMEKA